jgi:hypothetical protein
MQAGIAFILDFIFAGINRKNGYDEANDDGNGSVH